MTKPLNAEAKKLMKQAEPRIFTAGSTAAKGGGKAKAKTQKTADNKSHDLNF